MTRRLLRRHPVTIGFAGALLLVAAATGSLLGAGPGVRAAGGAGIDTTVRRHELWTLLTAALLTPSGWALLGAVAVVLVVVGAAERLLGPLRTLAGLVLPTVAGIATGLALEEAGLLVQGVWSEAPLDAVVLDPTIAVTGAITAASAFAGPLWRRRTRLLGVTGLVVAVLYSGGPADVCRLAAGVAGLLLGALLARSRPRQGWRRSSHHEVRSLLAALVCVTALGPLLAIVSPSGYGPLRPLGLLFRDALPGPGAAGRACVAVGRAGGACARRADLAHLNGHGAAVLPVLVLATLLAAAWGIWHGRRASALLAIALNGAIAVLTAVYFGVVPALRAPAAFFDPALDTGPTFQQILAALVPAGVAVLVLAQLRHLVVRPERRTALAVGGAVAGAFVAGALGDLAAGALLPHQLSPRGGLLPALADLPHRYVPIGFLHLRPVGPVPVGEPTALLHDWIGPAFWGVLLVGAVVLRFDAASGPARDGARLRSLLRVGGAGSLSYMATWTGGSVWFSADGANAVGYRKIGGVALALGEPAGRPATRVDAARAFALDCDDRGLLPAWYAVSPGFAAALSDGRRWATLTIGADAVVRPRAMTLQGKAWKDVRTAFNRARRAGVTTAWTTWAACTPLQRAEIQAVSEEWVAAHGLPELGYTLGGIDELKDPEVAMMLALDADGRVLAATSWLPTWRDGVEVGWTLDFMRRAGGTMNGAVELAIASVLLLAAERDLEFVSLSASPLGVSGPDDDRTLRRLLDVVARTLEPAYGFTSLAAFKSKFQPEPVPLVLAYPDALAVPSVGIALTRAYLPYVDGRAAVRLVTALR